MNQLNCQNCEFKLNLNWISCPNCGKSQFEDLENCSKCELLISNKFEFCPFCGHHRSKLKSDTTGMILKFKDQDEGLSIRDMISSLGFDISKSEKIINSKGFTNKSIWIIILSGLFFGFTIFLSEILFDRLGESGHDEFRYYLRISIIQVIIISYLVVLTRLVLTIFNIQLDYKPLMRYFSTWALVSIIKDLILYPIMLYIFIFEGTDGAELLEVIVTSLMWIFLVYLILHFLFILKSINGKGVLLNLSIISILALLAFFMGLYVNIYFEILIQRIF